MRFFVADTFMKSLSRLSREDQNLVKQAAFEFQASPANPGFSFHKLDRAKDARFWSFRVNRDLRIIVHRDGAESLMLCYSAHHDDAYQWAERRVLDVHPVTGAAQLVEVQERVDEVVRQVVREEEPPVFQRYERGYLLGLGVPEEWVDALRTVGESAFLDVADRLPQEAAERLLDLIAGKAVPLPSTAKERAPLDHPDAQRRFRQLDSRHELEAALAAPWERWTVFLHPDQRHLAESHASGPMRVSGGAGTGKSVVALHRAAFLARSFPGAKVLLTTFSKALAARLEHSLSLLMGDDPARERVTVRHLHAVAHELVATRTPSAPFAVAPPEALQAAVTTALHGRTNEWLTEAFIRAEWEHIVDSHGITTWQEYKAVSRKGRGVPLSAKKRQLVWAVMDLIRQELLRQGLSTFNLLCAQAASGLRGAGARSSPAELALGAASHPWQHVVVDECQDFGPAELGLLRALAEPGADDLFFCGDEGQRIYKPRVSWLTLGIDVRGRSHHLTLNYRTTEQIRRRADALLPGMVTDGDGAQESHETRSLLSGPMPQFLGLPTRDAERAEVASWLQARLGEGLALHEIALFARSTRLIKDCILPALREARLPYQQLNTDSIPSPDQVAVGTLHGAKGLEFRAVAIVGCDRDQLPLASVLRHLQDPLDRETFIDHERHLLYVACTRARDHLQVTWTGEGSRWI